MNTDSIIAAIDDGIARLTEARALIMDVGSGPIRNGIGATAKKLGRPAKKAATKSSVAGSKMVKAAKAISRPGMTSAGRKAIADAMKARWAKKREEKKAEAKSK